MIAEQPVSPAGARRSPRRPRRRCPQVGVGVLDEQVRRNVYGPAAADADPGGTNR